ncbi:MAG: lamin tail domain-containing protein, partial [Bacteroidota bacterium]
MIRLCTVLFLLYAATNAAAGQASLNGIIFNEVLPKPNITSTSGFDTDGDGVFERDDEFIELVNNGTANVDLNGYELYDAAGLKLTIPGSLVVAPGEFIVFIFDYDGTVPAGYFDINDGSSVSVINDGSEGLYLCNPASGEYIGIVYGGRTVTNPTVCTTSLGVE